MIEFLLIWFCGKNNEKKKKVKTILKTIEYDTFKNIYSCTSSRFPDQKYFIHWDSKKKYWWCECEAKLYEKYKTYETLEEMKKQRKRYTCIHIIATMIFRYLHHDKAKVI